MNFEGLVWRYIPRGAHPLDYHAMLWAGGRWNRQGKYGCLYTSLSREGILAEYRKILERNLIPMTDASARDLVSIEVSVNPVLDLCSCKVIGRIGVDPIELTGNSDDSLEYCRTIADWARGKGYWAILSPSAALPVARNLNIYLSDSPEHLSIKSGKDRFPLNY